MLDVYWRKTSGNSEKEIFGRSAETGRGFF